MVYKHDRVPAERSLAVRVVLVVLYAGPLFFAGGSHAGVATTPAPGFQGIWYEIEGNSDFPNKYGGGLATYPQQVAPLAVYSPTVDRTYFTFSLDLDEGPGRNIGHAVSYFDHSTGLVARPQVWLDKQTSDAHDAPVLALDDDGYLYLFSNTHGEVRQSWIRRSSGSHQIDSYVDLLSSRSADDMRVFGNPASNPGASGAPRFSYSSAWYVPNATEDEKFLMLHTRYLSGQRDLFTTTSTDGDVWTQRKTLAQIESGQYQTSWIKPDGATVGTIFNVHPAGQGLDWRNDLFYLETADQASTWRTIDGVTLVDNSGSADDPLLSRPIGNGSGAALAYDAAPGERVYLKDLNYDSAGNPVILFLSSPSHQPGDHGRPGPDRFVKTAHWTGADWSVNTLTSTNHNYDHGSLYVEPDGAWRVIAPFLEGPQAFGTGGEIGMWTSVNQGADWTLDRQLTYDSGYNHTYVQRPLHARDDFYAFWADGDAWEPSTVHLYFANRDGDVFHLPYEFDGDYAAPKPFTPRTFEIAPGVYGTLAADDAIAELTIAYGDVVRTIDASSLVGARLTAFEGTIAGGGRIADVIVPPSSGTPPSEDRAGLLGDLRADSGFANPTGWTAVFDAPVFNGDGPDIVLLDWGSPDSVDVMINGVTREDERPQNEDVFERSFTERVRYQSDERDVMSLEALLQAQLSAGSTTSAGATAYVIDLSDFGFAYGAQLGPGEEIAFSNGEGVDPTALFALPMDGVPGDFNGDGLVDAADYTTYRDALGDGYSPRDYAVWASSIASGVPSGATSPFIVPEASTGWCFTAVAITGVLRCRSERLTAVHLPLVGNHV